MVFYTILILVMFVIVPAIITIGIRLNIQFILGLMKKKKSFFFLQAGIILCFGISLNKLIPIDYHNISGFEYYYFYIIKWFRNLFLLSNNYCAFFAIICGLIYFKRYDKPFLIKSCIYGLLFLCFFFILHQKVAHPYPLNFIFFV